MLNIVKTYKNTELSNIDIKYDDNIKPDIKHNFSIDDQSKYHDKISYNLNDKNYTTINQLIDKSIQYAAYVLHQEKFYPDFIISPPSSSRFNEYYCTNLSKKLNIPYHKDFLKEILLMSNLIKIKTLKK